MPLKIFDRISGKLGFRLTAWYTGIIITCMMILFIIAHVFLSETLKKRDLEEIRSELNELEYEYDKGGIEGVKTFVNMHLSTRLKNLLFIRIADTNNRTLLIHYPFDKNDYDIESLAKIPPFDGQWIIKPNTRKGTRRLSLLTSRKKENIILQLGMTNHDRRKTLHHFENLFMAGVIPLMFIAMIFGDFMASRALNPLRHIILAVESMDIGKMDSRVPRTENGDELDELARLFNDMLERIARLIRGMKESLDNVAHDLRTPLTRMRNISEQALLGLPENNPSREAHESVLEESDRILNMLNTLMDISEAETGVMSLLKKEVSLKKLIVPIYEMYQMVAETRQVHVAMHVPDDILVYADPDRIGQALANLLDNAVKFTEQGGRVVIEAEKETHGVRISVRDTGPGIPGNDIERIWDRLYRGDQSRSQKGLGLGLSLVNAIVTAHGGTIEVVSRPGEGSDFIVRLPVIMII